PMPPEARRDAEGHHGKRTNLRFVPGTNIPVIALYVPGSHRRGAAPRAAGRDGRRADRESIMEASASRWRYIRVALVRLGNCASSFVQGIAYYRDVDGNEPIPGLMNAELGGYRARDIQVSAAFDINATKVGLDVSEAIFAKPNNTF